MKVSVYSWIGLAIALVFTLCSGYSIGIGAHRDAFTLAATSTMILIVVGIAEKDTLF